MRIAKAIAASGLASRREAESWIGAGRVTLNGVRVETPATLVSETDVVQVDGKNLPQPEKAALWLFHKPKAVMTTRHDPQGRPTIYDHLPAELRSLHPVGRLDYNSEGLLILTNNGELKRQMELPSNALKRVYRVRLKGVPSPETLAQLKKGVTVEEIHYRPMQVKIDKQGSNSWLQVTITEGKNREIRRIFEFFGHPVSRLIRIAYGEFQLGDLPSGQIRKMKPKLSLA